MNRLIIIFLVFLMSCSNEKKFEKQVEIIPPKIEFDKGRNPIFTIKEYYFHGKDSSKLNLQKISKFHSENEIASESHLLTSTNTETGRKIFYDYRGKLLVQKRTINSKKDSTKTLYFYNSKNQLIKREQFYFQKKLRPEVIGKFRNSDNISFSEKDFEKKRSWDKSSEIYFSYDSIGQKTEYYAPKFHWDNQNKYKWFYDQKGNIITKQSWNHNELIWTESYSYKENDYSFTRVWNNEDYQKEFKFYVFKNKYGQKIKEITMKNDSIQVSKKTYQYYRNGMKKRKDIYGENNERLTTYIYKK